jgi:hypothetical protein
MQSRKMIAVREGSMQSSRDASRKMTMLGYGNEYGHRVPAG